MYMIEMKLMIDIKFETKVIMVKMMFPVTRVMARKFTTRLPIAIIHVVFTNLDFE
jgi:hypothetical protein